MSTEYKFPAMGEFELEKYCGVPVNLQDWLEDRQKKQLIYGLTDYDLVLLATGPVSVHFGSIQERP